MANIIQHSINLSTDYKIDKAHKYILDIIKKYELLIFDKLHIHTFKNITQCLKKRASLGKNTAKFFLSDFPHSDYFFSDINPKENFFSFKKIMLLMCSKNNIAKYDDDIVSIAFNNIFDSMSITNSPNIYSSSHLSSHTIPYHINNLWKINSIGYPCYKINSEVLSLGYILSKSSLISDIIKKYFDSVSFSLSYDDSISSLFINFYW